MALHAIRYGIPLVLFVAGMATGHSYRRRDVANDPMPGKPAPIRAGDSNAA